MIDLHCHILPELDDGALSVQDSIAMARQAQSDGIEAVCATPHIRHDHDVHISEIASRVADLQNALRRARVDVRILAGGELAQTAADALTAEELCGVSLGGLGALGGSHSLGGSGALGGSHSLGGSGALGRSGGWVLLEPAPGPLDDELVGVVDRLAARGVRSIVAHPERHAGVDLVQRLEGLVEHGCLIQWTADFVLRAADGDLVLHCARDGLVHLLGSDAHSSLAGRPVALAGAFERLRTVCPPAWVAWMAHEAPRAILAGEPVRPPWHARSTPPA